MQQIDHYDDDDEWTVTMAPRNMDNPRKRKKKGEKKEKIEKKTVSHCQDQER